MSSIVPYVGAIAPRAALRIQRAYRGYRMARRVYRRAKPYARFAKRKYRMAMRMNKRRKIFHPENPFAGTSTSKRREIAQDVTGLSSASRTLFTVDMANIPHGGDNNINERQRNLINLRGVKICMEVQNRVTDALYFNIAVLVPKRAASVTNTDFFRSSTAERAVDFDPTALTGLQFHCLPINSDKYKILWHKRRQLIGIDNTALTAQSGKSYMTIQKYIKFKRQVRFNNNTDVVAEGASPFVVYWASGFNTAASQGAANGAFAVQRRFVTYFREPKP